MGIGLITLRAQEVITAGGDYHNNAAGSVSNTVGEPITETFSGTTSTLTQGFQQVWLIPTILYELSGLNYEISVSPNPALNYLNLKIVTQNLSAMQLMLYSPEGKLLLLKKIESIETGISFDGLSSGSYILKVTEDKRDLKSFKIIKAP
jgi:hypothetical protein